MEKKTVISSKMTIYDLLKKFRLINREIAVNIMALLFQVNYKKKLKRQR